MSEYDFHIRRDHDWVLVTFDIVQDDLFSGIDRTRFRVSENGTPLGKIERIENYVSHQTHDGIRYDNKPVTVWRALSTFMQTGLYADTRIEAIADLADLGLESSRDLHQSHRAPWWVGCPLHG